MSINHSSTSLSPPLPTALPDATAEGPAKKNLAEAPFFSALIRYVNRRADSFHCPGHSGGAAFSKSQISREFAEFFGENLLRADICNAVEEMGQLLDHSGAAAAAEENAAAIFNADHLFFVTNGTSTSNKIVWHSQVGPDDIVVVDRNCHKSNLHAIMMTGATPIYLTPTRNHHGLIGPIPASEFSIESIERKILANPFVKNKTRRPRLLTITQSTYDGIIYNVETIKTMLDGRVHALHFDEAWLPHATFHPIYENMHAFGQNSSRTSRSMIYSTQSTHKTLAGLSQASQILINNSETSKLNRVLFNEAYLMHTSTSPQYSIIASCDVAAAMMGGGRGKEIVEHALREAIAFRRELRNRGLQKVRSQASEKTSWWFDVWGPPTFLVGHSEAAPSTDLDQRTWLLNPGDEWHGFGELQVGFNQLDPLKVTVLNPGLSIDGNFTEQGIPAQIVAKYLCENGVIVEKCGLYSFFIMFTIGITRERWQRLLEKLEQFKTDYDSNRRVSTVMPIFTSQHTKYANQGLRDLCQEIHTSYQRHDVARMTTEMYTSDMTPAMKPSDAFAKMAQEKIDRVEIDQLAGRATAVLLTPYPPGIPLLVPGEIFNASIVRYLKFAREFNEQFPGFETDVHGLVRETSPQGERRYFVDCVRTGARAKAVRKEMGQKKIGLALKR